MVAVRFAVRPLQALAISLPSICLQHGKLLTILRPFFPVWGRNPLSPALQPLWGLWRPMSVRWFSLPGHFTSPGWEPTLRGRRGGLVRHSQRLAYMSPVPRHFSQTKQGARTSHRFMLSTRAPHTRSPVAATTGGPPLMQGKQLSDPLRYPLR
ncbi:unnamed protein product [Arctogadus glacialis]